MRGTVQAAVPRGATVLVVARGDNDLLTLQARQGWHFPRDPDGGYAGGHPADSDEAIAHLEELRRIGASHLVFPRTSFWWLDHYGGFARHLARRYETVRRDDACLILDLTRQRSGLARSLLGRLLRRRASPIPSHGNGRMLWNANAGKKKVLYILHNHPVVRPGGAETYALELYESMQGSPEFEPILLARSGKPVSTTERPHEGTVFTAVNDDPNQHFIYTEGFKDYDWFSGRSLNKGNLTRHLRDFLLSHKPDVVHLQQTLFLGYDALRVIRDNLPNAAIVHTLHEYLPICYRHGQLLRTGTEEPCSQESPRRCHECFPDISAQDFFLRKQFIQSQLETVDLFLAPSRFLLERYVDWGIPRAKIRVEDYGRRPRRRVPTERGKERPNRFGFFGQLSHYKGVLVLLRAMKMLADEGSDVRLLLHGANLDLEQRDFQDEFREQLEALQGSVTFVGPYDATSLPRLMQEIDWVVVPSIWWENSPLVIQEAFMYGRPVICSDIGGMAEKVEHGVSGLHFRAGNPASLADTLTRAAATRRLWKRLSKGIPPVLQMDDHIGNLTTMYRELLEDRARLSAVAESDRDAA